MSSIEFPGDQAALQSLFGNIDIYVFDQILRGRLDPTTRLLDAGCGDGRNSEYLMRCGAQLFAVDKEQKKIEQVRSLARECAPGLNPDNFTVAQLTELPFADAYFKGVICSAVLHFAEDEQEFEAMMRELWRVLDSGGILFTRLASKISLEDRVRPIHGRRHGLPDGSNRFLVDEEYLLRVGDSLGATLADPLKTTNVQNLRAMTTWVLRKS